jgi:hypothetical protein
MTSLGRGVIGGIGMRERHGDEQARLGLLRMSWRYVSPSVDEKADEPTLVVEP